MYLKPHPCGPGKSNGHSRPACADFKHHLPCVSRRAAYSCHRRRAAPSSSTRPTTSSTVSPVESITQASGCRPQGGDLSGRIPQVPLGYLARKGGKANIGPLVFQLLIAPLGPFFGGRGEEYLEVPPRGRPRCPCRARRPPVPGAAAKARWRSRSALRTSGQAATREAPCPAVSERISAVTSSPASRTARPRPRALPKVTCMRRRKAGVTGASSAPIPALRPARATRR